MWGWDFIEEETRMMKLDRALVSLVDQEIFKSRIDNRKIGIR